MIFSIVKSYTIYQEINFPHKKCKKISRKIVDFTHNQVQKFVSIAGGLDIEKSWGVPQAGGVEIKLGGG